MNEQRKEGEEDGRPEKKKGGREKGKRKNKVSPGIVKIFI